MPNTTPPRRHGRFDFRFRKQGFQFRQGEAGVPTAMLFIRNEHGSHNPDEAMTIPDFIEATKLLTAALAI